MIERSRDLVALYNALVDYSFDRRDAGPLVIAAAEAIAAGEDSPALRELAGCSIHGDPDLLELAEQTFRELDLVYPWPMGSKAADLLALGAGCRELLRGGIGSRELTSWAHSQVGHEGADEAQELVLLDDEFDEAGENESAAMAAAQAFIAHERLSRGGERRG